MTSAQTPETAETVYRLTDGKAVQAWFLANDEPVVDLVTGASHCLTEIIIETGERRVSSYSGNPHDNSARHNADNLVLHLMGYSSEKPSKLYILHPEKATAREVLYHTAEMEGVDAVYMAVRRNGQWSTVRSAGIKVASLCMAAMKLQHDVMAELHDEPEDSDA